MVTRNNYGQANGRIRRLIYKNFPSNARFSLAVGSYPEHISRTLNGYRLLTTEEAHAWATALAVPLETLASITRQPEAEEVANAN